MVRLAVPVPIPATIPSPIKRGMNGLFHSLVNERNR